MSQSSAYLLSLRGIHKRYGNVHAVADVDLDVEAGEVRAVLGENGAGKSTLMGIISGTVIADEGVITVGGDKVPTGNPAESIRAGVAMVHQHSKLVDVFTVAENVALARTGSGKLLDVDEAARRLRKLAEEYELATEPDALVQDLSVGARQRSEILRALLQDPRILVLDEPTAVLTPQECSQLFGVVRRLSEEGRTVLLITHRLEEVFTVCDTVTVLRHGRVTLTEPTAGTNSQELAAAMVGTAVADLTAREPRVTPGAAVALSINGVTVPGVGHERNELEDFTAQIAEGELVAVVGVDGNGQDALMGTLCGLRERTTGTVSLQGETLPQGVPGELIKRGVARIPGDRQSEGLVMDLPVWENLLLGRLDMLGLRNRAGLIRRKPARALAAELVERFDIRVPNVDAAVATASGGNQQKIVLARELATSAPSVVLAMNPTRGLDVGAARFVHRQLDAATKSGTAVLLVTSDLDEALALADRILVISQGRIAGTATREQDRSEIGLLMAGVTA